MARIYGLKKKLTECKIDAMLVKEIIGSGDLVDVTSKMEALLDPEIVYQVLDSCACGTSRKLIAGISAMKSETLEEKIEEIGRLGDFHSGWIIGINPDNTLTAGWHIKENESFACVCSADVGKKLRVRDLPLAGRVMPLTYCFCCAGHCRQHLQKLLDIELRTKEIVSSPINSGGKKPCEFIFEIV